MVELYTEVNNMAYDKRHKKDYYQINVKLDHDRDADVIEFFKACPNKRRALCAVVRYWLDPILPEVIKK